MKIVKLQVMYEKLFPHGQFSLVKYKELLQMGLLEKLPNNGYDDMAQLESHILRFSLIEKLLAKKEDVNNIKSMSFDDIKRESAYII